MDQLSERERLALFIDGAHFYATARRLDLDVDFKRLIEYFRHRSYFVRALYYTLTLEDTDADPTRPLIDWLSYNGYTVITKLAKRFSNAAGESRVKGSINVELATGALRLAPSLDHIVLFLGDGNFRALVAALKQAGKNVTIVSTVQTSPPMVSEELRREADSFIDLADLADQISRMPQDQMSTVRQRRKPRYVTS